MKIAVCSSGRGLEAAVDPRFGRCSYFLVTDADGDECEAVPNQGRDASGGAGVAAAQLLGRRGVEVVLAGSVGPKAMAALTAAGIEVYTGISGTVSECLADYRQGRLTPVSRPPRWG